MTKIEASPPISPDPRLLERLVCPITKQAVYYDVQRNAIISPAANCAFPVRDGIPIMLPEEAQKLSSTKHTA